MTRSELIDRLVERYPQLTPKDVQVAVQEIFRALQDSLLRGKRIEIRGFGAFGLGYRAPRIGRNPKTGEAVTIAAKRVPHFKPGKELKERVNQSAFTRARRGGSDS